MNRELHCEMHAIVFQRQITSEREMHVLPRYLLQLLVAIRQVIASASDEFVSSWSWIL